jgi:hypothetical protein
MDLGPPFTHPTLPNRAHYVGATTPRSSPAHYLASVQALFQAYELDICSPLLPYNDCVDVHAAYVTSFHLLNGALVGLISSWEDGANASDAAITESVIQDSESPARMPYVQDARPPAPTYSTCFGIALIRSVPHSSLLAGWGSDWNFGSGVIGCRDALPYAGASLIPHSRVFVKGEMELPVWGMLDYAAGGDEWKSGGAGVEWGRVAYLQ